MNLAYLALGGLLLAGVVVDLLWTTLWVEGGVGPLTSLLMAGTWRTLRRFGSENSRALTLTGPAILVLGLTAWIVLLWSGWTLVFAGAENALVDTRDGGPVSWGELVYFVGYSVFTLGNGDFAPRDGVPQIATALSTASGMLFITMSVTYVLSVLDAVTQKRSFASGVTGLGMRGDSVVRTAWNGHDLRAIELPLNTFVSQLNALTANHKAYPILHYFYSEQGEQAPVISVAVLDDALTILRFGVPEQDRPNGALIENARSGVDSYLETLGNAFIRPADRTPVSPDLASVRDAGIPTVSESEFAASLEELDERRRTLLGLVESDARQWPGEEDE